MFQGDDSDELMAVFGLDPKLYTEKEKEEKFPENHLGRIFFNLRFEGWNWVLNFFKLVVFGGWQVRQSEWKFGIKDTEYKEYSEK